MDRIDKFTEVHPLETGVGRAGALFLCEQNDRDDAISCIQAYGSQNLQAARLLYLPLSDS